jgi:drug/metabolite transporter (DMT)-like permease
MKRELDAVLFMVMASSWALNFSLVKFALFYEGAEAIVLFRVVFALTFSLLLFGRGIRWPRDRRSNILLLIYGMINIVAFMSFWMLGESTENSALSSIIIYTFPIISIVLSIIILHEKVSRLRIAGTILRFTGLIVVFADSLAIKQGPGIFLLLLAALSWACATILFKKYLSNIDSRSVNTIQYVFALPFLLLFSIPTGSFTVSGFSYQFLLISIGLGSVGTAVAYAIFLYLIRKYPVSEISSFFFTVPALSIVFSYFLLGVVSTVFTYYGFILISAGIFLSAFGKPSGSNKNSK